MTNNRCSMSTLVTASATKSRSLWVLLATLAGCILLERLQSSAAEPADSGARTIEVTGSGADAESARKDAYREAVRQVVGTYVSATTRTANDELIEDNVVALSAGFVEKVETLRETAADDLVSVRIRATVRTGKVLRSLKDNAIPVVEVDGASLGAELQTKQDLWEGQSELIAEAFRGYPATWFKASVVGKPELGESRDRGKACLIVTIKIEPDVEAYTASAALLDKALGATERPHGEFRLDGTRCGFDNDWRHDDANKSLSWMLFRDSNLPQADRPDVTALTLIRGEAFPKEVWEPPLLQRRGGSPVMFPMKIVERGSTWKWHMMQFDKEHELLQPFYAKSMTCDVVVVDHEDDVLTTDDWVVKSVGMGGDERLWRDLFCGEAIIIAPVVVDPRGVRGVGYLIPSFTCRRKITVAKEDMPKIAKISVTLK